MVARPVETASVQGSQGGGAGVPHWPGIQSECLAIIQAVDSRSQSQGTREDCLGLPIRPQVIRLSFWGLDR